VIVRDHSAAARISAMGGVVLGSDMWRMPKAEHIGGHSWIAGKTAGGRHEMGMQLGAESRSGTGRMVQGITSLGEIKEVRPIVVRIKRRNHVGWNNAWTGWWRRFDPHVLLQSR